MAVALDPSDPYYLQHSALSKQLAGLVAQYGVNADGTTGLTSGLANEFNIDPQQQTDLFNAAKANPYSTTTQLSQQLAGDQTGIQRTANAHGLFSGANAAATAHEIQAGGLRNYNASNALSSQLAGLQTTDIGNLSDATARAAAAAAADQTIPATPAAAPAAPAPTAAGYDPYPSATAALPPISTIGVANMNGDPRTGTSLYQPVKPPKPLTPKISLGHV